MIANNKPNKPTHLYYKENNDTNMSCYRVAPHHEFIRERIKDNIGDDAKQNNLAAFLISSLIPLALSLLVN